MGCASSHQDEPQKVPKGYSTKVASTAESPAEIAGPQFPISVSVQGASRPEEHLVRSAELVVRMKVRIFEQQRSENPAAMIPPPAATRFVFSNTQLADNSSMGSNGIVDGAGCSLEWDSGIPVLLMLPQAPAPTPAHVWPEELVSEMKARIVLQNPTHYCRPWHYTRGGAVQELDHERTVGENGIQADDMFCFAAEKHQSRMGSTWSSSNAHDQFITVFEGHKDISGPVEQLTLNYTWKDQGWGNQKGKIRLNAGGSMVGHQEFGQCGHSASSHTVVVCRDGHEEFMNNAAIHPIVVEGLVGGGGGHELTISQLNIEVQCS